MSSSERSGIGVLGAAAIGIGGMVGGGIFAVLGTAVGLAGGGTPIAFIIAGSIALLTAYTYSKLSVRYPSSGGTVAYLDQAFGIDLVTGSLNLMLWLSYLVTIALYASAFGSYGLTFVGENPAPWVEHALITVAILLPAAINVLNAEIVSKSETVIVVVKLALLAVVIAAGMPYVEPSAFAVTDWPAPLTLITGGMVIFVAYEGFELIANSAAEVRDPAKTLPRAFIGSVVFVIGLYILVAMVTVGTLSPEVIAESKDYALAEAARPALGQIGFTVVAISALLATFSAINATIYGNARLGYSLAKDGELPRSQGLERRGIPVDGVLATAGLSVLLANLVDLEAIAILGSAGFLIIFAAVNAAGVRLAKEAGASRVVCGVASLACLTALIILLWSTFETTPGALWVVLGMIAISVLFEMIYPRATGRALTILPADRDVADPGPAR